MNITYLNKPWNSPYLYLMDSAISGKGIYSKRSIRKNEIIMIWGGVIYTPDEILEGKAKSNSLTGFSEGLFLGQPKNSISTIDQYLNHSCDPNLWMLDEVTIAASRDIAIGEELTADYSFWELDSKWTMPNKCNCNSPSCRKIITGNDWQLLDLQNKYKDHFLPCINERIRKLNQEIKIDRVESLLSMSSTHI